MKGNKQLRTWVGPSSPTLEPLGAPDINTATSTDCVTPRAESSGKARTKKTQEPSPSSSALRAAPGGYVPALIKDGAKRNPGPRQAPFLERPVNLHRPVDTLDSPIGGISTEPTHTAKRKASTSPAAVTKFHRSGTAPGARLPVEVVTHIQEPVEQPPWRCTPPKRKRAEDSPTGATPSP